ncbi:MAG: transporter substrate-binding domain-containing protein [Synergistaceae bacterium]|jgi:cyclohexadienyl dehydratase|nr:transporter substrate-binding domain-containing protein [Synergistaceae bacterium]
MKRKFGVVAVLACFLVLCAFLTQSAAGDRLNRILENKILRVGTPGDYRPFSMLADGKYEGHDIDVVESIAKELGVKAEYVATSWKNLMGDLLEDKYDIAVGGITQTVARAAQVDFLPPYASFGKVALIRTEDKDKFTTPESLNQETVRVIKNPGGTNEKYVLENLTKAQVATHEKNAEIPGLIAEGKGDVMITETYEALLYSKKDNRLYAAFVDSPLTPTAFMGFMLPLNDPDFIRVMKLVWTELELRGELDKCAAKWLR